MDLLKRLGMEEIGWKRNPSLTPGERFIAMFLRALMMEGGKIVIDRPFLIMPDLERIDFIIKTLQTVEESFNYVLILDYLWNRERYEGLEDEASVR